MKKLLQLLNEYQTQRGSKFKFSSYDERSQSFLLVDSNEVLWGEIIISKKFWFIQWLVEDDKIILQKDIIRRVEYSNYGVIEDIHYYSAYKSILMYLAIQDNPIEFLISILK